MLKPFFRWTLAAAMLAGAQQRAGAEPYAFPVYKNAAEVTAQCDRMMADLKAIEARLQDLPGPQSAQLLAELDGVTRRYEDTGGPMALLTVVDPDKAIRDATEACDLKYQAFSSAFFQNATVYALLKQVQPADEIDRDYLRDLLDAFEDSGVALPAEKQKRAQDINNELTRLSQDFERRVREDKTQVAYTAAELRGVPPNVWKDAKRDAQGRYLLGMAYPVSVPVLERAVDARTRERMWRAFNSRGGTDNLKTLAQIADLRREYAGLFGFDSYADFVLRRRMAKNAANVQQLLDSVKQALVKRELSDLALLRATKARELKRPVAAVRVERWDVPYYIERARRAKYAIDEEQFRPYFPPEASVQFVFRLATRLFGVEFQPVTMPLWHPDARAFEVVDGASKKPLGTLYVDLYPREDKFSHAAVWSFRDVSTLVGREPAAGLVVNLDRHGLTLQELETLLHEFGHSMHALLSQTRYASQGGTNVKLDFAEAPSQMLEDWVYDPKVLALFQEVCRDCKPVPAALVAKADKGRHFMKGILYSRQHLYASYDLAVYGKQPQDPMALWQRMEGATPLGYVRGSMFPAAFGHIASGYAAGYYSYLWSLVVAEDMRTAFEGHKLSPEVGRRYRETVLANGGQFPPGELLQRFLGRPTDSRAFFKWLNK
ncbi:MAG TPA: M3 family metallopeptidase [Albitalea sp.]|nr:M3 family metallopeptidase [Albitalea sp.]